MGSPTYAARKARSGANVAKALLRSMLEHLPGATNAEAIAQIDAVFDACHEVCPGGPFYREAVRRGMCGNLADEARRQMEQSDRYRTAYQIARDLIENVRVSSRAEARSRKSQADAPAELPDAGAAPRARTAKRRSARAIRNAIDADARRALAARCN